MRNQDNIIGKRNLVLVPFIMLMLSFSSCEIETIDNPNGPTIEALINGASRVDLQLLASGLEAVMREDYHLYVVPVSVVGREYYDLSGIDPRYTQELIGAGGGDLDNNGFLTTRSFAARYRAIRSAHTLITATMNSNASLTIEEENALLGYAQTIQGYQLLLVANRQYENGIRIEVSDPDNLGPFTSSHQESLMEIQRFLDEAFTKLNNGGSSFPFTLSSGFTGFDTPQTFKLFNRALAARVAIYRGDKGAAMSFLDQSFFDLGGALNTGVYHAYGGAVGNDEVNQLFLRPGTDIWTAHPTFLTDAFENDARLSKVVARADGEWILDGLSGTHLVSIYNTNTDPAGIIRNEELILIFAEANIGSDNDRAIEAINVIRNAAGIGDYSGNADDASLVDEILFQRRYSLFGEGHRWIDMRRYDRLALLPNDRTGDKVHVQFPRPVTEVN